MSSSFVHSDNDDSVVSGSEDGSIYVWNLLKKKSSGDTPKNSNRNNDNDDAACCIRNAHSGVVTGVVSHYEKHILVSCATDGTIKTWKKNDIT